MIIAAFTLLADVLAFAGFAASLYLAAIVLSGWYAHERRGRRPGNVGESRSRTFAIVVPAHDEQLLIASTLQSLNALDYPKDRYRIFVIADNCTDKTADIARERVRVVERFDPARRGKGYALEFAFGQILTDWPECEAVVVIDADTQSDAGLLTVLNDELNDRHDAVQAAYLGSNTGESWRTWLQQAAWSLFNFLRPLGRVTIGGSSPLLGNGMCFSRALLEQTPWQAFSIAEDVEFAMRLAARGTRIQFTTRACVYGQMARSSAQATAQRLRWEEGRSLSRRTFIGSLLKQWWNEPRWVLIEAILDLLFPPTAALAGTIVAALALSMITSSALAQFLSAVAVMLLSCSVLAGLIATRSPGSAYLALLASPVYVLWKTALVPQRWLRRKNLLSQWVRTDRHPLGQKAATSVKK